MVSVESPAEERAQLGLFTDEPPRWPVYDWQNETNEVTYRPASGMYRAKRTSSVTFGVMRWLKRDSAVVAMALLMASNLAAAQAVRDVTPKGVVRVYREDTKKSFREPGDVIGSVRVLNDGTLSTSVGPIRLYGVKMFGARELCRSVDGGRWTCGARAIGALRGYIDVQSIECAAPKNQQESASRVCFIGNTNLSLWLLEQGWADVTNPNLEKEYGNAVALAKSKRVGLWSNGLER